MRADMELNSAEQAVERELLRHFAVGAPAPAFVEALAWQLRVQAAAIEVTKTPRRHTPRFWDRWLAASRGTRWAAVAAALLLVAAIIIGALGPQRVWAQVRRLLGYVPGIGLVQNDASLRVLAEPVQVVQDGIAVTVKQATADAQRTILVWEVVGLSVKTANSQGGRGGPGGPVFMRLPDGKTLALQNGVGNSWGTGYRERAVYPALPTNADKVTLVIVRLPSYPADAGPENWELPLRFVPAPADVEMLPVHEVTPDPPVASGRAGPTGITSLPRAAEAEVKHGIQVQLEQAIGLPDGYLLQGGLTVREPAQAFLARPDLKHILRDADGRTIPTMPANPDPFTTTEPGSSFRWAVRTNGKDAPGPWHLSIPSVALHVRTETPFAIDLGSDPQLGQTWVLDQPLIVAGHELRITTARLWADSDNRIWLNIEFTGGPDLLSVRFQGVDHSGRSTTFSEGLTAPGQANAGLALERKPSGRLQLEVNTLSYVVTGPWELTWDPPDASAQTLAAPTSSVEPCLTEDSWARLVSRPVTPAAPLAGRLLVQDYTDGRHMPLIYLANSDGSQRQDIAHGAWSALSPNGAMVVFVPEEGDGLRLADVRTGRIMSVPGTIQGDYHPVWSPDSGWIVFKRGLDGLYVVRPDGIGLRQVNTSELIEPMGWFPEGQRLLATMPGPAGLEVVMIQVETGDSSQALVFDSPKGGGSSLAPDGRRVAYSEVTFDTQGYGLFLANADGSGKRLLAALGSASGRATAWSPDGAWLAVTVGNGTPLLIRPDTCEVVRLPFGRGEVTSWVAARP